MKFRVRVVFRGVAVLRTFWCRTSSDIWRGVTEINKTLPAVNLGWCIYRVGE